MLLVEMDGLLMMQVIISSQQLNRPDVLDPAYYDREDSTGRSLLIVLT